jgi:hypothetical protein
MVCSSICSSDLLAASLVMIFRLYFKISRQKTTKNPALQKRPVKRCNLEQLYEDEAPATHLAVPTSKRRRSKSLNEEENTLIPDPAQLLDKSMVKFRYLAAFLFYANML